jgi:hypothetical protein
MSAVSPVVLVTRVGDATGSRAAAAALACAASEPDRAALLIDLDGGRAPRPSLIATAGARDLEERLAAHMSDAALASKGSICCLKLPGGQDGIEQVATALPLVRESAAIVHLPPGLLRAALEEPRIRPTGALLRADLSGDRALTALAVRDLMACDLRVAVLKRSPQWLSAVVALRGVPAPVGLAVPAGLSSRLLSVEDNIFPNRYNGERGSPDEPEATQAPEGR